MLSVNGERLIVKYIPPLPFAEESLPRTRYGGWGEGKYLPLSASVVGESLPRTRYGGWDDVEGSRQEPSTHSSQRVYWATVSMPTKPL